MAAQTTDAALERLEQGNARFMEDVVAKNPERQAELAKGQSPEVAVLACADSRVAPEIAFNRGLGELFVVRVAGNVANSSSIASLEYAVAHLGVRLIVVMAHESCGAVGAALQGGDAGKNLNHLLGHITPAIEDGADTDVNAVARASACANAERLVSESEILRSAAENDGLQIATAFFHFSTGEVEFF